MQPRLSSGEQLDVLFSFAESLIHQTTVSDLLWYAAEQVVAKVGFIDCVIYVFEAERQMLVQSAAIGEKLNERHEIINPLEIPLDRGVTGECARTRTPIILPDAGAHPKYVADNIEPGSEVCVPILGGDRLFGVIDCEHPEKNSFGLEQVKLLNSVAALVASQWLQCELIAALQLAEQRARAASQAKSKFLQNMSHEMRTPLNGVLGASQLVTRETMSAKNQRFMNMIESSADLMLHLVDTVLDITQIEAGAYRLRPSMVNLRDFFSSIEDMFELQMRQKGLRFSVQFNLSGGESFHVDPGLLSKLVINFTGNALKFTEQGHVEIIVERRATELKVEVIDTGCGIEPDDQEAVFERFVRTESASINAVDGAGVGLALCTELIKQADGQIGVSSAPGEGSTFWFSLPEQKI